MAIFSHLIQRPEPRNMIQTLFLGKTDYDRYARMEGLPVFIADVVDALRGMAGGWDAVAVRARAVEAAARWAGTLSDERKSVVKGQRGAVRSGIVGRGDIKNKNTE